MTNDLSVPQTSDGKPIFLPNLFRGDVDLNFPGAGDDATGRGKGQVFQMSHGGSGEASCTWKFNDWVYIAGGFLFFKDAILGDWLTFNASAIATTVTEAPQTDGNCNLTDLGGFNIITPAAGDGTHNVADVDKIPIPAENDDGYWEWDDPDEGKGNVTPGQPGKSSFNLFDVPIELTRWVTKVPLLGTSAIDFKLNAIKPKKLLPHWDMTVTIFNTDGSHTVEAAWHLFTARKKTT